MSQQVGGTSSSSSSSGDSGGGVEVIIHPLPRKPSPHVTTSWREPLQSSLASLRALPSTEETDQVVIELMQGKRPLSEVLWNVVAVLLAIYSYGYSSEVVLVAVEKRLGVSRLVEELVVRHFYRDYFIGPAASTTPQLKPFPLGELYDRDAFHQPVVQARLLTMTLHVLSNQLGLFPEARWRPGLTQAENVAPAALAGSLPSQRKTVLGEALAEMGARFHLLYLPETELGRGPRGSYGNGNGGANRNAEDHQEIEEEFLPPCMAAMIQPHLKFPERSSLLFFLKRFSTSEEDLREKADAFSVYEQLKNDVKSVWRSTVKGTSCQFVMGRGCCSELKSLRVNGGGGGGLVDVEDLAADDAKKRCFSRVAPGYNPGVVYNPVTLYIHLRDTKKNSTPWTKAAAAAGAAAPTTTAAATKPEVKIQRVVMMEPPKKKPKTDPSSQGTR